MCIDEYILELIVISSDRELMDVNSGFDGGFNHWFDSGFIGWFDGGFKDWFHLAVLGYLSKAFDSSDKRLSRLSAKRV